jgi:hypothetical protein
MTKIALAVIFSVFTASASLIVGVKTTSIDGFVGPFPSGPESITIQYGTGDYQEVTGYETSLRPILPVGFEFPEFELTSLAQAAQFGEFSLLPNVLADYELGAALMEVPAGPDAQKDFWNLFNGPVFALDAGMIADLGDAEKLLSSGSVDFTQFFVLTAIGGDPTVPEFEVRAAADPVSTPEPAADWLIGLGLAGLGIVYRKRAAR